MSALNGAHLNLNTDYLAKIGDDDRTSLGGAAGASIAAIPMFGVQHTPEQIGQIENHYEKNHKFP